MHSQVSLPYRTERLQMSSVLFESMVNNLGTRIRRMNLEIHFKTKNQLGNFITAMQRANEREDAEMDLGSDDEQGDKENPNAEEQPQNSLAVGRPQAQSGMDSTIIEQTFEKSILLREHFLQQLREIEGRLKVKFMVVPQRVKISGCSRDRVEQAHQEYRELQEDICFQPIDRAGRQVFLSRYFRGKLLEGKVHIVQILRKYYFWFLKSEADPKELLMQVFMGTRHSLYPLRRLGPREKEAIAGGKGAVVLGEVSFGRTAERITEQLYVSLRARLFEDVVRDRLKEMEDRQERQVELSDDRRSLIMHMDAEEQLEIQSESIEEEYKPFKYLYLVFPEGTPMQDVITALEVAAAAPVGGFKKAKKTKEEEVFIWEVVELYLCLAFTQVSPELTIEERIALHPLTKIVSALPKNLLNFRLGIYDTFELPQTEEWAFLTDDRDKQERLTLIGVKSFTKKAYERLARLLIEQKLSGDYFAKEMARAQTEQLNASLQQDVSIDLSRKINDSTQFLVNDVSMRQEEPSEVSGSKVGQVLSSELVASINYRFEGYNFLLAETAAEREKKYASADIVKPSRQTKMPYSNKEYENKLLEATTFKFKLFRVKLPPGSRADLSAEAERILADRPELAHLNRWITVFTGGKEGKEVEGLCEAENAVRIVKIEKNYKMREGFLVTTNPIFIHVADSDELPACHYEPVCFFKKIDDK